MSKGTWEIGEVSFPLSEAKKISIENIKKRFTRALITALSVTLGIAFMVTLLLMAAIQEQQGKEGAAAYLYWLLFISLMVCGVGITNSMLIAVAERYKEIGTYKTLGALDRHILQLFLLESIVIGGLGGLTGYIGGLIAALAYAAINDAVNAAFIALSSPFSGLAYLGAIPTAFSLFILALTVAMALSLIATLYPAYYAARLNPVEALRYEV